MTLEKPSDVMEFTEEARQKIFETNLDDRLRQQLLLSLQVDLQKAG